MILGDENAFLREQFSTNLVEPNEQGYIILTDEIKKVLQK